VFLLEILAEVKYNEGVIARNNRGYGMLLLLVQSVMAAVVPILIPIAQNMISSPEPEKQAHGDIVSYLAIVCSLLGTVCLVIEQTRKFGDIGYELFKDNAAILSEVERYLGLTNDLYEDWREPNGNGHKQAWHIFMQQYMKVRYRSDIDRNNVYAGKNAGEQKGKDTQGESDFLDRATHLQRDPEGYTYRPSKPGQPNRMFTKVHAVPEQPPQPPDTSASSGVVVKDVE
jgi:hypothetical protein